MNNSHVDVTYRGSIHRFPSGTTVGQIMREVDGEVPDTVLSALVNRRQVMLDFPVRGAAELTPVRYGDREGESVYKRSVSLMFYEACAELYPEVRTVIGQSLGNCYHYQLRGEHPDLREMAKAIQKRMLKLHRDNRLFRRTTVTIEEVENYFRKRGREDKLALLKTRRSSTVHTISCGEFVDIAHGPYAPDTGCLPTFGVMAFEDGLLLRFPRRGDRSRLPKFTPRPLLYATYVETRRWQELLEVQNIGQLNELSVNGGVGPIVRIAEGLHEKKISQIADEITGRLPVVRVVTIAGPSSSGKTTFARRLGVQLRVNGVEPISLSLDNYYVDRHDTPLDDDGQPDFESLDAIDLDLFHAHLAQLLEGRTVTTPRFDFVRGSRRPEEEWLPLRLGEHQILVIEGIHGLNERLTSSVPRDRKVRVYVSALSQLAIDDHNRIFTSDARLIRRLVRDRLFRGFTAERTLELWERVRRGEARWIFPFQEQADVMFNSALVYEPAVLKTYAERFLLQVPKTSRTYPEAFRLLKFLSLFVPVFPDEVPQTSLLREFIGGSSFSS
ncbi:MAG: nucleoside kinase [Holophagae bacterium]|jgi:uridine kinase